MKKYYGLDIEEHGTNWKLIELALEHVNQIYLKGKPGMGKTYAALHYGLNGRPVSVITLTPDMPAAELRGMFIPKDGRFEWFDGVATREARRGGRLVINEVTNGSSDCMAFLFPILEDITTAKITLPTGETVQAHPNFQVVATDNRPFEALEEPLQSRFVPFLCDEPHPNALDQIPKSARKLVYDSICTNNASQRYSLRHWTKFFELSKKIGAELAAEIIFKDRATDMSRGLEVNELSHDDSMEVDL